jgi:sugar transferase (PEP-CTERM/EpsH1 system associated)
MPASSFPNVLFLAHRVPYPPDKGDRIRTYHVLRFLSQRARVHLACLADEPVSDETKLALSRYCEQLAIVPVGGMMRWLRTGFSLLRGGTASEGAFHVPEFQTILRRWASEIRFDVSLASASSIAACLRLDKLQDVPAVIDLMDVDSQKWFDYAASHRGPRAWLYRTEGKRLRQLEQSLATWAAAVTFVGDAEVEIFQRFCPEGRVHAVTNGVDLDYFHPSTHLSAPSCRSKLPSCVFVGALDYYPNVEAAQWFCREVWPEVLRRRPEAKFYLVGRRPSPTLRRLASQPEVELVGQVADVRPYVAQSSVTVVPLRIARGVQNKVLESLAMAKATIVSPQTLAGLKACPGVHLLQASSSEEWQQTILALFDDPSARRRIGEAGRRYVEEHHSWERCLKPLGELLGLGESRTKPARSTEAVGVVAANKVN